MCKKCRGKNIQLKIWFVDLSFAKVQSVYFFILTWVNNDITVENAENWYNLLNDKKIQLKIKKGNWYFGGKLKLKKDGVWKWI